MFLPWILWWFSYDNSNIGLAERTLRIHYFILLLDSVLFRFVCKFVFGGGRLGNYIQLDSCCPDCEVLKEDRKNLLYYVPEHDFPSPVNPGLQVQL